MPRTISGGAAVCALVLLIASCQCAASAAHAQDGRSRPGWDGGPDRVGLLGIASAPPGGPSFIEVDQAPAAPPVRERTTNSTVPTRPAFTLRILSDEQQQQLLTRRRRRLQSSAAQFDIVGNTEPLGYYAATLHVGTPGQPLTVIVDTGSSRMAVPCTGCSRCGSHTNPYFAPAESSSFVDLRSSGCRCTYSVSYVEGSSISGFLVEVRSRLFFALHG
eukprot:SAG22_NODE_4521_length_1245_cov_1.982548_1_plen_218_part_00